MMHPSALAGSDGGRTGYERPGTDDEWLEAARRIIAALLASD